MCMGSSSGLVRAVRRESDGRRLSWVEEASVREKVAFRPVALHLRSDFVFGHANLGRGDERRLTGVVAEDVRNAPFVSRRLAHGTPGWPEALPCARLKQVYRCPPAAWRRARHGPHGCW